MIESLKQTIQRSRLNCSLFVRILFSQPRLDILIFLPMLGLKYVCEYFQFLLDFLMTVMALMEVWSQTAINKCM